MWWEKREYKIGVKESIKNVELIIVIIEKDMQLFVCRNKNDDLTPLEVQLQTPRRKRENNEKMKHVMSNMIKKTESNRVKRKISV